MIKIYSPQNILVFVAVVLCTNVANSQCEDSGPLKKIALVIGVSDYDNATSLRNPGNDAADMTEALQRLGFEVLRYVNPNSRAMKDAIDGWTLKLNDYDIILFYYSGHGAEVGGQNYIFYPDSNPLVPPDMEFETYPIGKILGRISASNAKIKIALFDACRNNPFVRGRNIAESNGLASASARGALIGFAAEPGTIALDGEGRNGTYTAALLKYIETPNLLLTQIFTRVTEEVLKNTRNTQHPYIQLSLTRDLCLKTSVQRPGISADEKLAKSINQILSPQKFNSSLNEVLAFEFGQGNNSIAYESLPKATECRNAEVRYYWRYLHESRMRSSVMKFMNNNSLGQDITQDSYVMYVFKDNRLLRTEVRFFSSNSSFYPDLISSLAGSDEIKSNQYKTKLDDRHYMISIEKLNGWDMTQIVLSNTEGFELNCTNWWNKNQ